MGKELLENQAGSIEEEPVLENGYQRYLKLGGIINKKDYQSALNRMRNMPDKNDSSVKSSISQVTDIAGYAGIELSNSKDCLDPRVGLYIVLSNDVKPAGVKYHHSQMSDQRIFGEVLRMLEDSESLDKLIKAYPNISFKYKREKTD